MNCCSGPHPWDLYKVRTNWFPSKLRCLIIGENPGYSVNSSYFYQPQNSGYDPVTIRRNLLFGLYKVDLIGAQTLQEFQQAGFLFDHAIRCYLSAATIEKERRLATRYKSPRAAAAIHLEPAIKTAPAVWVMGYIARNAVASICSTFPRNQAPIAKSPYPCQIPGAPKFFVSRYLSHLGEKEVLDICKSFAVFFNRRMP